MERISSKIIKYLAPLLSNKTPFSRRFYNISNTRYLQNPSRCLFLFYYELPQQTLLWSAFLKTGDSRFSVFHVNLFHSLWQLTYSTPTPYTRQADLRCDAALCRPVSVCHQSTARAIREQAFAQFEHTSFPYLWILWDMHWRVACVCIFLP